VSALPPARDDLTRALGRVDELQRQVSTLLATQRELSSLLVASQARNGEQVKLLAVVRAMIDARDSAEALERVADILSNVIGAREFTIYALDPLDEALVPIAGANAGLHADDRVRLGHGWLGSIVRGGRVYVAGATERSRTGHPPPEFEAVVPLRILDRVVGAVVVASLLPHREGLDRCDREIMELLGAYAATAIIAADRRRRWLRLPEPAR
jgi:GAF domain-containing protein